MKETIPKDKNSKKAKWSSEEAFQIVEERREVKIKGERERYTQLKVEIQRIARRNKKTFFNEQYIKIEENNRRERLEISSGKLEVSREHTAQRWAQ